VGISHESVGRRRVLCGAVKAVDALQNATMNAIT